MTEKKLSVENQNSQVSTRRLSVGGPPAETRSSRRAAPAGSDATGHVHIARSSRWQRYKHSFPNIGKWVNTGKSSQTSRSLSGVSRMSRSADAAATPPRFLTCCAPFPLSLSLPLPLFFHSLSFVFPLRDRSTCSALIFLDAAMLRITGTLSLASTRGTVCVT